jgi:uracil-DNA glycosylase
MVNIGNDWDNLLVDEFQKEYYLKIREFLKKEYKEQTIYPSMYDIFNALKTTSYKDVKVVILGQDPYHNPGQAHGMSFSVKEGITPPPSLLNIYQEIENEFGYDMPKDYGYLMSWANQGVLLLNTILTVRENNPQSHKNCGWEIFTDKVIELLNERPEPIVFLLWGSNAKNKKPLITNKNHLILESVHPSPLSAYRGFFGCNHFIKANEFLIKNNLTPINWKIEK